MTRLLTSCIKNHVINHPRCCILEIESCLQDCDLVNTFALLGAAAKKICTDIRVLQVSIFKRSFICVSSVNESDCVTVLFFEKPFSF